MIGEPHILHTILVIILNCMSWLLLSTCMVLTSVAMRRSLSAGRPAWWRARRWFIRAPRSQGDDHWAKYRRNNSFHDSCSNSCWSLRLNVWNGVKQRTHRTAINNSRADVSYLHKIDENRSHKKWKRRKGKNSHNMICFFKNSIEFSSWNKRKNSNSPSVSILVSFYR